jgi:hypothetical protein
MSTFFDIFKSQSKPKLENNSIELPPPYDEKTQTELPLEKVRTIEAPHEFILPDKKETIKKCCESGDLELMTKLITEIRKTIVPDEYENYILVACQNNSDNICEYLLKLNLYPIDDNIYKYAIVLACETGCVSLFSFVYSKISRGGNNFYFLVAIKNSQYDIVRYIVNNKISINKTEFEDNPTQTYYLCSDENRSQSNNVLVWYKSTMILSDMDKTKLTIKVEHPLEMVMSKQDVKMFKIILPMFNNNISVKLKNVIVEKSITEGTKEGFDALVETGFIKVYNKKYFEMAKNNPEITSALIEYYQTKS